MFSVHLCYMLLHHFLQVAKFKSIAAITSNHYFEHRRQKSMSRHSDVGEEGGLPLPAWSCFVCAVPALGGHGGLEAMGVQSAWVRGSLLARSSQGNCHAGVICSWEPVCDGCLSPARWST